MKVILWFFSFYRHHLRLKIGQQTTAFCTLEGLPDGLDGTTSEAEMFATPTKLCNGENCGLWLDDQGANGVCNL